MRANRSAFRLRVGIGIALLFVANRTCRAQSTSLPFESEQKTGAQSSFAITRVKLSPDSEADDWGIGVRGVNFWAVHVTMNELIGWAYGINARQIERAPQWFAVERFDVDGQPDSGVKPSGDQYRLMLRTVLKERFALRFHSSNKMLPVYVLSLDPGGIKIPKAQDQTAGSSWGVHRGWLSITNMTFSRVAQVMQRTVFDRPVLDQTGLKDQYTFILKWRADDTQFSQMQGVEVPQETGTEDVDDIYTSARKLLGIKIDATKQLAPTIVIDGVSHSSPN